MYLGSRKASLLIYSQVLYRTLPSKHSCALEIHGANMGAYIKKPFVCIASIQVHVNHRIIINGGVGSYLLWRLRYIRSPNFTYPLITHTQSYLHEPTLHTSHTCSSAPVVTHNNHAALYYELGTAITCSVHWLHKHELAWAYIVQQPMQISLSRSWTTLCKILAARMMLSCT